MQKLVFMSDAWLAFGGTIAINYDRWMLTSRQIDLSAARACQVLELGRADKQCTTAMLQAEKALLKSYVSASRIPYDTKWRKAATVLRSGRFRRLTWRILLPGELAEPLFRDVKGVSNGIIGSECQSMQGLGLRVLSVEVLGSNSLPCARSPLSNVWL